MPDLDDEAVEAFWQAKGRDLARTVTEIERLEDWTVDDNPRLRDAVVALGRGLDAAPAGRFVELAGDAMTVDSARIALAYMRAGRRFRMLSALAEEREDGPVFAARILSPQAEDADAGEATRALRGSVRHLARLNLLYKLFSPERLDLIRSAIAMAEGQRA